MADVLGLASSIIGLATLGTDLSERLRSLSDGPFLSEDLRHLTSEVEILVQILHKLPEVLQEHQSVPLVDLPFDTISAMLRITFELLGDFLDTLQAGTLGNRLKRSLASHNLRKQIASILSELTAVKASLTMIISSVVTILDQVLLKILTR